VQARVGVRVQVLLQLLIVKVKMLMWAVKRWMAVGSILVSAVELEQSWMESWARSLIGAVRDSEK
jgi:hypothetical protein